MRAGVTVLAHVGSANVGIVAVGIFQAFDARAAKAKIVASEMILRDREIGQVRVVVVIKIKKSPAMK